MSDGKRFNWAALDRHLTRLGWSLQTLDDQSGLDERNLRKIRDGEHQPRVGSVKLIVDALVKQGDPDPGRRPLALPGRPTPARRAVTRMVD